jgi:hypothetical protein
MTDVVAPLAFHDEMTLDEARELLRKLAVKGGHPCPVCTQLAKVYKRTINAGMARSMIVMWKVAGTDFQHVPTTVGGKSREEGKLRYWGLVEEELATRADGGRAGYWRLTDLGADFVHGRVRVPKYARVYDERCLNLTGPPVSIKDALGKKFNYAELMAS